MYMYNATHVYPAVFYFVLGNVSPLFRSKTRHIQLVALAKSQHLKKYGVNAILEPIVNDIKKLVCEHVKCRKNYVHAFTAYRKLVTHFRSVANRE